MKDIKAFKTRRDVFRDAGAKTVGELGERNNSSEGG